MNGQRLSTSYLHSLSWWTKFDIKVNISKISFHHVLYDDEIVDQKILKKKVKKKPKEFDENSMIR